MILERQGLLLAKEGADTHGAVAGSITRTERHTRRWAIGKAGASEPGHTVSGVLALRSGLQSEFMQDNVHLRAE